MLCPKCFSGELYRDFEPEKQYGEDLTEELIVNACCKSCDQETKYLFIFCEEVLDV